MIASTGVDPSEGEGTEPEEIAKCARDRLDELRQQIKHMNADWAEDDTEVKQLAAPWIGDFDGPRPENERGLGFRGAVDVVTALVQKLAELRQENALIRQALMAMKGEGK